MKIQEIIIVGDSAFAEIAYEYFTFDSSYRVIAFAVERKFLKKSSMFGLPIYPLEDIHEHVDVKSTGFHCAVVYTQLNRLRSRLIMKSKSAGLKPVSYVSSKSFVWQNVELGEHCFIFEDNTLQPFVKVGSNVVLWSGNHIGHHSVIEDNVFIASHAVISGFCRIGNSSFIGVNSTISNNVDIGKDNWIGLGATITKNTQENQLYKGNRSELHSVGSRQFFGVKI